MGVDGGTWGIRPRSKGCNHVASRGPALRISIPALEHDVIAAWKLHCNLRLPLANALDTTYYMHAVVEITFKCCQVTMS